MSQGSAQRQQQELEDSGPVRPRDEEVSVTEVSRIVQSKLIAAFNTMCCLLKEVPQDLIARFEQCRCCPTEEEKKAARDAGAPRPKEYGFKLGSCPMTGTVWSQLEV